MSSRWITMLGNLLIGTLGNCWMTGRRYLDTSGCSRIRAAACCRWGVDSMRIIYGTVLREV